jgi:thiamine biosynthesis protein ThiS
MKIFVNGEAFDCDGGATVTELIQGHGLSPETTLVEHNGKALHRRDWPNEKLQPNDRLEILSVAAGG